MKQLVSLVVAINLLGSACIAEGEGIFIDGKQIRAVEGMSQSCSSATEAGKMDALSGQSSDSYGFFFKGLLGGFFLSYPGAIWAGKDAEKYTPPFPTDIKIDPEYDAMCYQTSYIGQSMKNNSNAALSGSILGCSAEFLVVSWLVLSVAFDGLFYGWE